MRKQLVLAALGLCLAAGSTASAATVTVPDSSAGWAGFMNVFARPADGGGYIFGSPWGVADLRATFNDTAGTVTMSPNTIGDADPFWYIGGGAPGSPGNKIMEANLYVQVDDGSLSGQTVTFSGNVISNTYTSAHQAFVFIRDFAPDFSSLNQIIVPLGSGPFSIDLATIAGAGRHVQYGFQTLGVNVWATDTAPFGSLVIGTVPAPTGLALLGVGGLVAARRRRTA